MVYRDVFIFSLHSLGQPEVHDLHMTIWSQHDVGWFQVSVNDSFLVSTIYRLSRLYGNLKSLPGWHSALRELVLQGMALYVLHDDEVFIIHFADLMDFADKWMVYSGS